MLTIYLRLDLINFKIKVIERKLSVFSIYCLHNLTTYNKSRTLFKPLSFRELFHNVGQIRQTTNNQSNKFANNKKVSFCLRP